MEELIALLPFTLYLCLYYQMVRLRRLLFLLSVAGHKIYSEGKQERTWVQLYIETGVFPNN